MNEQIPSARILIVEDSMGVARSLSLGLGLYRDGIYRVDYCGSGEDALKNLLEASFDLLITDFRLPGIDGLTLLERAFQLSPSTRSILITAYGSPDIEARAQELANAYLAKPFTIQDLLGLVERVLREPVPTPAPVVVHKPTALEMIRKIEQRKSVHLTVLACDLDGTLTDKEVIAPATWETLRKAKSSGIVLVLVTGRTLDSFMTSGPFAELFSAIVAENGAVVHFPRRDIVVLPFGRLNPGITQQLHQLNIPLEWGMAIAATVIPQDEPVLWTLRDNRVAVTIEYNRSAVMLLPPGATKGNGLLYALDELGYSPHNVIAVGDAENDRSLFEVAEVGVAVANAEAGLRKIADLVSDLPAGRAIRTLVQGLIDGKIPQRRVRQDQGLLLGYRTSGSSLRLDPYALVESNTGIFGSSRSGKSWLAGLLAEELLKQKYQVCLIDPEGDYRGLGASPRSLVLGGPGTPLLPVAEVLDMIEWNNISLVLDLSSYGTDQRTTYMDDFLRALRGLRARRGRPHYFLVDEVQSFCPHEGGVLTDMLLEAMSWGGFSLISYRPSQVAPALLDHLDHWLLTRLNLQEEIETLRSQLEQKAYGLDVLEQLPSLAKGQAYLCLGSGKLGMEHVADAIKFRVGARAVPHVRHLHKYLRAPLPEHKRFYFDNSQGLTLGSAANLWEFCDQLSQLPVSSLRYHLDRGDFARWFVAVLHDEELAHRVTKVARRELLDEELRETLLEIVNERYEELEALI